jgi:2-polyprenyl-3-methyl-5-hydroxy-6-metoxy-1,4-benzoquinol methylase
MSPTVEETRTKSFGQDYRPTKVDRFGVWLSARALRRHVRDFSGRKIADVGCGYHATFSRTILDEVEQATLIDVALAADLKAHPKVRAIEGQLPDALALVEEQAVDVVMCVSVLEHLAAPELALHHLHRILKAGGVCLVNVPSWRGKVFLELSAYRLGLSPAAEMDDHKTYYDPRDLWPLLVRAGFLPRHIRCYRHKLGLNTFAVCRKPQ